MTAVQAAPYTGGYACNSGVPAGHFIHFLLNILKEKTNHPDAGNDEGTQRQRSEIVSERPPEASGQAEIARSVVSA